MVVQAQAAAAGCGKTWRFMRQLLRGWAPAGDTSLPSSKPSRKTLHFFSSGAAARFADIVACDFREKGEG
jgi:hypothetical protein